VAQRILARALAPEARNAADQARKTTHRAMPAADRIRVKIPKAKVAVDRTGMMVSRARTEGEVLSRKTIIRMQARVVG